jgi:hypothetical protein
MTTLLQRTPLHLPRRDLYIAGVTGWPRVNVPDAPRCVNPERRRASKKLSMFKHIYFPKSLYPQFIDDPDGKFHGPFLDKLEWLIRHLSVVYCAEAAPRGIGKTWDVDIAVVFATCHHLRDLILRIELEGKAAEKRIGAIKTIFQENPLLLEDFPEIVQPIRDFGGDARSAHPLVWSAVDLMFANKVLVSGRGIDGALRGFNINGKRPELVLINDIESEETIRSEAESNMRRARMEKEISALHGQGARCSYLYTQTVPAIGCIADEYTDQNKRPAWNGTRLKARLTPPKNPELWEQFVQLGKTLPNTMTDADAAHFATEGARIAAASDMPLPHFNSLDFGYKKALELFAEKKTEMLDGIEMLEPKQLPVHRFYMYLAEHDEAWIASEMQNEPESNPNIKDLQLVEHLLLARRIEGLSAAVVPAWAAYLTVTIDLGLYRLHWEVDAWTADGTTSHLVASGIEATHIDDSGQWRAMTDPTGQQLMSDEAIRRALERLCVQFAKGFPQEGTGEIILPSLHGIDCGGVAGQTVQHAWDKVVFSFCAAAGGTWLPLKGESPWTESISDRAMGRWFICEEKNNPGRRIDCHVDGYKKRAYDAYQLPTQDEKNQIVRGTRTLHMDTAHHSLAPYCKQQTAEKHVETFVPGQNVKRSMRIGWVPAGKSKQPNHWFDTCWMAYAVSDIYKFKKARQIQRAPTPQSRERSQNPMYS